ncbi:putative myosin-binding protein [Helianthus annuus]|nr:putative myosin-binding protein [Helianthus annuus]
MAANKFATMLHNNTNNITLILIYTLLEWILIILLLLNSVFSYLIIKFTQFFGLNPPCFACARIDRIQYHLCELHSKEVSELKFCSNHKKLAEFRAMCENCSSSDPGPNNRKLAEPRNIVFSKVERIDVMQIDGESEVDLKCSCCGVNFERKSSCFVIHPLWDVMDIAQKVNSIDDYIEKKVSDDRIGSNYEEEFETEETGETEETEETGEHEVEITRELNSIEENLIQFENGEDLDSQDLQFFTEYSGDKLFPFELADKKTEELSDSIEEEEEDHEFGDFQEAKMNLQETVVFHENLSDLIDFGDEKVATNEETQIRLIDTGEVQEDDSDSHPAHEEEEVVSIGTHIPVLDSCDEIILEEPSTVYDSLHSNIENDCEKAQEEENVGDLKNLSVKIEEIEEERAPDTPSGMHSPNPFHKKWLIPKAGAEESFDGSVISETDNGDPVNTAEKLKSALKSERKALRDLYLELEEERNASAVAANETMAMINRLQEEKAAMQMEALQYQRMMEEQSEYDQEALQLLNELMMKKEKELESYRKKVLEYKAKEKMKTSSVSEDDEGSSVDLYHVTEDANTLDVDRKIQHAHTPIDSVLDLESTLADFEEERISILEQLKFLEEKLVALSDEEDQHFANVRVIEDHYEETNAIGFSGQVIECTTNNGFVRTGKQAMGKQLLPLFDVAEDDVTVRNGYENGFHPSKFEDTAVMRFELEKKRIDMEEEIDQLHVRLQALEADREFLKHCIGSMKKGDKGMEVLLEILHHLRDLRDVNLRAKSYTENVLL